MDINALFILYYNNWIKIRICKMELAPMGVLLASDWRGWRLAFKRSCQMAQTALPSSPSSTFQLLSSSGSSTSRSSSKSLPETRHYWSVVLNILIIYSIMYCKKIHFIFKVNIMYIICYFGIKPTNKFSKIQALILYVSLVYYKYIQCSSHYL